MAGTDRARAGLVGALALAAALGAAPVAAQSLGAGAYLAARSADADGAVDVAARRYADALRRNPGDAALMGQATLNLVAAGRVVDAVPIAERLVAVEPSHRMAQLTLAAVELAAGRHARAGDRLLENPDAFMPLTRDLLAGWAAYGRGEVEQAAALFEGLDGAPVLRVFGRFHLGLLHGAAGDDAAAVAAFEIAQGIVTTPTTHLSAAHGIALERLGRVEEAIALYERTAAASRSGDAVMLAAIARARAGEAAEPLVSTAAAGAAEALFGVGAAMAGENGRRFALAHARLAVHLRPGLAGAQLLIAELLDAEGQAELAQAAYEAVAPDSPLWLRAQIGRATAMETLGREDAATEALRALTAQAPASVEAQVALADLLRRRERFEAAADAYGAAIDLMAAEGRESWILFYQRAVANERAGNWPPAEADFLKALALEPDQPLVLNYLGYSWVEMRRNLDQARAMIERAVELRPEDGYITDSLGWVLYRLGDFDGAVEWLERAVALAPVDPVINDHLGDALWKVGRKREAEFQWRRARSFEPAPEDLARIKRKLAVGLDVVLRQEAEADAAAAAAPTGADGG